jgi:hypothetical protein
MTARQRVIDLIRKYGGRALAREPQRFENLLRDLCGEHKREIHGMVCAVRENIPESLLSAGAEPVAVLYARLSRRLHENFGLDENLAAWSVETWAISLGMRERSHTVTQPSPSNPVVPASTVDRRANPARSAPIAREEQERRDAAKLVEPRERLLETIDDPAARVQIMLELAAIYRDRLGDDDQAAVYLHGVLELQPENQIALAAYAEHFREKGDWAGLLDLLEFYWERERVAGASPEELLPCLQEIATVAEEQLGDDERALAAWRRVQELAPTFDRASEARRHILRLQERLEQPG